MAEAKAKKKSSKTKSWWTGLKAEYAKIIWPTKASIVKTERCSSYNHNYSWYPHWQC